VEATKDDISLFLWRSARYDTIWIWPDETLTVQLEIRGGILNYNLSLSLSNFIAADAFNGGVVVVGGRHGDGAAHCLEAAGAADRVVC